MRLPSVLLLWVRQHYFHLEKPNHNCHLRNISNHRHSPLTYYCRTSHIPVSSTLLELINWNSLCPTFCTFLQVDDVIRTGLIEKVWWLVNVNGCIVLGLALNWRHYRLNSHHIGFVARKFDWSKAELLHRLTNKMLGFIKWDTTRVCLILLCTLAEKANQTKTKNVTF